MAGLGEEGAPAEQPWGAQLGVGSIMCGLGSVRLAPQILMSSDGAMPRPLLVPLTPLLLWLLGLITLY